MVQDERYIYRYYEDYTRGKPVPKDITYTIRWRRQPGMLLLEEHTFTSLEDARAKRIFEDYYSGRVYDLTIEAQ